MPIDLAALNKMASDAQQLSFAQLMLSRQKKGFQHFFTDLKGYNSENLSKKYSANEFPALQSMISDREGRKWKLEGKEDGSGSMLIIEPGAEAIDFDEIHLLLNTVLGERVWFQKAPDNISEDQIFSPSNPHPNFKDNKFPAVKTLGKVGANAAVDPIFVIVGEDGKLKVLAGKRPTGEKAFPGGMNEDTVKETCLNELLEEVFGGSLFDGKSDNSTKANALSKNYLEQRVDSFLVTFGNEFKKLTQENKDAIANILKGDEGTIEQKLEKITELKFYTDMNSAEQRHMLIRLKCKLYEHLLPDEFTEFKKFVDGSLTSGEQVVNQSDPRNTAISWMVTTPLVGLVTKENFYQISLACGLNLIAGDDLVGPQFMDLAEIVNNGYSDHPTLALNAIAMLVKDNKLTIEGTIETQLSGICDQIGSKMKALLEAQESSSSVIVTASNPHITSTKPEQSKPSLWKSFLQGHTQSNPVDLKYIAKAADDILKSVGCTSKTTHIEKDNLIQIIVNDSAQNIKQSTIQQNLSTNDVRQVCEPKLSTEALTNQAQAYAGFVRESLGANPVYLTYENTADQEAIKAHALETAKSLGNSVPAVKFEITVRDNPILTKEIKDKISKGSNVTVSASHAKL